MFFWNNLTWFFFFFFNAGSPPLCQWFKGVIYLADLVLVWSRSCFLWWSSWFGRCESSPELWWFGPNKRALILITRICLLADELWCGSLQSECRQTFPTREKENQTVEMTWDIKKLENAKWKECLFFYDSQNFFLLIFSEQRSFQRKEPLQEKLYRYPSQVTLPRPLDLWPIEGEILF